VLSCFLLGCLLLSCFLLVCFLLHFRFRWLFDRTRPTTAAHSRGDTEAGQNPCLQGNPTDQDQDWKKNIHRFVVPWLGGHRADWLVYWAERLAPLQNYIIKNGLRRALYDTCLKGPSGQGCFSLPIAISASRITLPMAGPLVVGPLPVKRRAILPCRLMMTVCGIEWTVYRSATTPS
jgi:hypothetical protein